MHLCIYLSIHPYIYLHLSIYIYYPYISIYLYLYLLVQRGNQLLLSVHYIILAMAISCNGQLYI